MEEWVVGQFENLFLLWHHLFAASRADIIAGQVPVISPF
jgi:hypothetical protein